MSDTTLNTELKQLIIDTLDLEDISANDIEDDAPLFIDGLGLDSIDALELGVALQKRYGVKISAEDENTKTYFSSINALAQLVSQHKSA